MSYGYQYGYAAPYAQRRSAPASLHIVAIVQYLGGLFTWLVAALFALIAFGSTRIPELEQRLPNGVNVNGAAVAIGLVAGFFFLVGLIAIVLGRKVQAGRNWARIVLTILNGLSVLGSLAQLVHSGGYQNGFLPGLLIPLLCLILLNTGAARSWCHYRTY